MVRKLTLLTALVGLLVLGIDTATNAQEGPDIHVVVNMVQLNVAVTDKNGNYVTGLHANDFTILEDGIV